jgi:hypothetical protein
VYYSLVKPKLHWKASSGGTILAGGPNCFWIGSCGANVRLSVPPGRPVHASSGSGDVNVSGLTGAVRVGDASGDIVVNGLSGPLDQTGPNSHHTMYLSDDSGDINVLPAS